MTDLARPFGPLLRQWRQRRSLSQLALAAEACISQRHLSFIECGRATPSRHMVIRLAEQLAVPLRERNTLLAAAGYAPLYRERTSDDPDLAAARRAIILMLRGHEPFPALAVDRHWIMVEANAAVAPLMKGVDPTLLEPPVNVMRLSLHPDGLAPRIANFREWRAHLIGRLAQQIEISADPALIALKEELAAFPVPPGASPWRAEGSSTFGGVAIPFQLRTDAGILSFISATTIFGTAHDLGLSELAIESFFPANARTSDAIRAIAGLNADFPDGPD